VLFQLHSWPRKPHILHNLSAFNAIFLLKLLPSLITLLLLNSIHLESSPAQSSGTTPFSPKKQ
jgi:hypothetical protein